MLKIIDDVVLKKNSFSIKEKNISQNESIEKYNIYNQFKKYLLKKKIECDSFSGKEKEDGNKNVICSNFTTDILLNIFDQEDILLNLTIDDNKNNNFEKKKSYFDNNIVKENTFFSKNIKNTIIKKNKKDSSSKLEEKSLFNKSERDKQEFSKKYELSIIKNIRFKNLKKINNRSIKHLKSIFNINENYIHFPKDEKNFFYVKNKKNNEQDIFSNKNNTNRIDGVVRVKNILKNFNKLENVKFKVNSFLLHDSENYNKWNQLIFKKILLSIANKKNQAEMYLKPDDLGNIYIKIKIKNGQEVILNFITNNNTVKTCLDNYMSFLRDSLIKNGIKLKKFNIYRSLKNKHLNDFFYKNDFNLKKLQKLFIDNENNFETINYKSINAYV